MRSAATPPSISVVIATCQSERTIGQCLESVRDQQYPQERVRIILADGGSTDRTLELARRFGAEVIAIPAERQNAEYNKGVGARAATGDFLLLLDHDNVLPHPLWLQRMLQPLLDHPEVVGTETLRYRYDPSLSLLDRYCALFGANDPVVYALGKCDRLPWFGGDVISFGAVTDAGPYYLVKIHPDRIPTLGANGFLVRRDLLMREAQIDADHFFHIDVNADLIRRGYDMYAFTKDDILHLTAYKSLGSYLYRRWLFLTQYALGTRKTHRRYEIYRGRRDFLALVLFVIATLTLVKPTWDALRGYARIPDAAWFLHPVLGFALLWVYGYVIVTSAVKATLWNMLRSARSAS